MKSGIPAQNPEKHNRSLLTTYSILLCKGSPCCSMIQGMVEHNVVKQCRKIY